MGARGRDQWSQAFKEFAALHQDVGRAVSPAGLQTVGEKSIRQCFEALQGKGRPSNIAAKPLEPSPVAGRHHDIGMYAHPALAYAARWWRGSRLVASIVRFVYRLDTIAEPTPRLAGLGAGGDPRANGCGHQGGEEWVVGGEWVVAFCETALF
jgi:hypothetical protein